MLFSAGSSCGFQICVILHVVFGRFFMRIPDFRNSACCYILIFHADSRFSHFCMLSQADSSCRFSILAILHVASGWFFMRILNSCDSACCYCLIHHSDSSFLRFCMLFQVDRAGSLQCWLNMWPNCFISISFDSIRFSQPIGQSGLRQVKNKSARMATGVTASPISPVLEIQTAVY